jgi:aryl-phospho-beta-D-glucosidase BglC (GH1 family)
MLTSVAAIVTVLSALGDPFTAPVRAQIGHGTPPPGAFALPASAFAPKAVIQGTRITGHMADQISRLHTVPLVQLGRVEGYLQTATWTQPSRVHGQIATMSLQYEASLFSSSSGADAAYGDGQASLWELGHPIGGWVANEPTFSLAERDGHGDAYLLLYRGPIELELRLRYSLRADSTAVDSALWYLRHATLAARTRAQQIAGALPPASSPTAPVTSPQAAQVPLPPIYQAPWGTGPVVKSPSLLVLDESNISAETRLDPGTFRPFGGPSLASRAVPEAKVLPSSGLSCYARTASVQGKGSWYDAAALYQSPQLADRALTAMVAANHARRRLQPYPLNPGLWKVGRLGTIDAARAWQLTGERIFAFRLQNVLFVLSETGQEPKAVAALVDRLVTLVPTWPHADGTQLMTAAGDPVRLAALNWYGTEHPDFVVGGLDFQPYQTILQNIKRVGYNTVRLPFSNQLVEQNPVVSAHLAANSALQGLHALDILDRIINYAGALGISVILDDHRSDAGWSAQESGLWYTPDYPDAAFDRDWVTLAQRYAVNNVVIGADLRNEPHGPTTWGDGNLATDWLAAAERAGDAVLAGNPHLLIIVEGIQFYGKAQSYWWGGSLMGVATAPVLLHFADGSSARSQLVYSAHDYGPDLCSTSCPWFNTTTTYESLVQIWDQYWGYIAQDPTKPYAAPVWVGEFGTCDTQPSCVASTAPGSQGQWFSSLVRYIAERHLSWAYWAANGTESDARDRVYGALDWYGFFDHTWSTPYPMLVDALHTILSQGS